MRYRSLDRSYIVSKWRNRCLPWCRRCQKKKFLIFGAWKRPQYQTEYRSKIIGELLFLFFCRFLGSQWYIMYRREAINWYTRRVGLDNWYCNYLAICRYFFIKKLFQSWIIYIFIFLKSLISVLHFFLCKFVWFFFMFLADFFSSCQT